MLTKLGRTISVVLKYMMKKKNVDCRNPSKNARVISMKYEIKFSSSRKKLKIKKLKKNLSNIQDAVIYKLLRTGGKIFGS